MPRVYRAGIGPGGTNDPVVLVVVSLVLFVAAMMAAAIPAN